MGTVSACEADSTGRPTFIIPHLSHKEAMRPGLPILPGNLFEIYLKRAELTFSCSFGNNCLILGLILVGYESHTSLIPR